MPRYRESEDCTQCGKKYYAKGLCKPCYMEKNRASFNPNVSGRATAISIDRDDLWKFVKKELNLG
jgi:hypothetical protein